MTLKAMAICAMSFACVAPAYSATPNAYATVDRRSKRACIESSALRNASVGAVVRFSDRSGMDARIVTGNYPQAHMNGAGGTVLCLYNRATGRAETQDMSPFTQQPPDIPRRKAKNEPQRALAPRAAILANHLAACFGLSLTGPNKVSRIGPIPAMPKIPLSNPRTPCAPQKSE
jgi:hypothetical protein